MPHNDRVYDTCRNCESKPADTRPKVARETKRQQPMQPCMYDTRVLGAGFSLFLDFQTIKYKNKNGNKNGNKVQKN